MEAILKRLDLSPTIAGEARTLDRLCDTFGRRAGCWHRSGQMRALRRKDIVVLPRVEEIRMTTYLLHKRRSTGLADHCNDLSHTPQLCVERCAIEQQTGRPRSSGHGRG